ncbi:ATP-binding response regulator [Actinoplanes sp. HUAS TT8]|uniref:ATP-binding response regulator n=1 Tax=Actinoplanes sp. HUAS TT8 TaxID=3447453 RepID=UPI003F51E76B
MTTVLIVDDRATNREVAREALSDGGYEIIEASDGRQALQLARARHPDVVLTDMLMPGLDGYQFAQEMRNSPETSGIPLVFYTANYSRDEVQPLARAIGVSRIVEKTASPAELLDAIAEALHESPSVPPRPPDPQTSQHIGVLNAKLIEKTGELAESEARFAAMAEASPVGILITDRHGHATYVNPGARQITGCTDDGLLGHGWLGCLGMTSHGEAVDRGDCRLTHPDGTERRLTVLSRPILGGDGTATGSVVTIDDVTALVEAEDRRRLADLDRASEARRQATARFDSMARLAGGVAHDFNNLLNIVLSFADFIDESVEDAHDTVLTTERADGIHQDVDRIRQAGRRAADLTHQLLTFGGKEVIKPEPVDLNAVVRQILDLVPQPAAAAVQVTTDLPDDLSAVKADAAQLGHALINLATNAVEAMPHGGRLRIITENIVVAALSGGPENLVHLSLADSGHGMSTEILDQAMEPFFTTKPKGDGPGLGLSAAYGIVRQSGGRLVLESEPGRGTTAHIYLPPTRPVAGPPAPSAAGPGPAGRTVLVAEDEPGLREVIVRILSKNGFHVLPAADGEQAGAIAREHDGPIHAVLTDVVMPVMNGRELAAVLAVTRPGVPILFMSGYAEPLMNEQGLIETDAIVLNKPFTRDELLAAMRRTLAATSPSAG